MGKETLDLIRKALDEMGKEADRDISVHAKYLHAARDLLFYEYGMAYVQKQRMGGINV
jgi:hypothetical protein